ncbi:MAG TPA: rhodanese-like domain-containing protein [Steroidobacteraceae bacterium]|nr:rhodanese-like domain-containing protein [Steroidobacteraceae bacterium]
MTELAPSQGSTSAVPPPGLVAGEAPPPNPILARARDRAPASKPGYAGNVTPQEAWELASSHAAVIVDVRTAEERQFVGRITDSIHVPWSTGPNLQRNPRFVRELEAKVRRDEVVLLLCRSGARSVAAAQALTEARFRNAFNILEGFEGELDETRQRGHRGGWRFHGLPWAQD